MRTLSQVAVVISCLIPVGSACGQSCDWRALFADLTSSDAAVSDGARKKAFGEIIPRIESEDARSLDRDIIEIIKALREGPAVRLQASGLLAALSMHRPDGATALARAVPPLMALSTDDNPRVRRNAVTAVANLKPRVPPDAIDWLAVRARDSDEGVAGSALHGLARSAGESAGAVHALTAALSQDVSVQIRRAALLAIGYEKVVSPVIIVKLRENLNGSDREVVKETIRTVARLGSAASDLSNDLEQLVAQQGDKELSSAAANALSRLKE